MKLKNILNQLISEIFTGEDIYLSKFLHILEKEIKSRKEEHSIRFLVKIGNVKVKLIAGISQKSLFLKRVVKHISLELNDKWINLPKEEYEVEEFLEMIEKEIVDRLKLEPRKQYKRNQP